MALIQSGLLAAILTAPDDDTPRLVLADWLDEHGDAADRATAEFIRVQCRLEELRPQAGAVPSPRFYPDGRERIWGIFPEFERLRSRERELKDAHSVTWFRLLSRRPGFGENLPLRWWPVASNEEERAERGPKCPTLTAAIEGETRRGFLHSLRLDAADWLAHGDAILAEHPVRKVELTTRPTRQQMADRIGVAHYADLQDEMLMLARVSKYEDKIEGVFFNEPNRFLSACWPGIKFTLPPTDLFNNEYTIRYSAVPTVNPALPGSPP